ncbi:DUF3331 domain-containing protein [Burkholderia cenocepacia]|uniref:DUF3331 domain-containing protein n=1 Tax=Burkholderia cenocepacia TaxID=95486 RepID=UPI0023B937F8|nr:DUF3331 domain-containing protein [Burkholderia cenocepacia]MDF0500589.1 DUF3331 domain-containing protein [Burkholderia cenocepacia]
MFTLNTTETSNLPLRLLTQLVDAEISVLDYDGRHLWLRWVEPGRCHFGEQRWLLLTAKHDGYCILSGAPVRRGQPVFRPGGRPLPPNAGTMILPDQLEATLVDSLSTGP